MKTEVCKTCQNFHFDEVKGSWCTVFDMPPKGECKHYVAPGTSACWPKNDQRAQKDWWAPGEYMLKCANCGDHFVGDKRARICADCAYDRG